MSDPLDREFPFTDLSITLRGTTFDGMLLSGTATLSGDDDGFDVTAIKLDDGPYLTKCNGNGWVGMAFEDEFFKRIASVIENPKTTIGGNAEAFWSAELDDYYSPESTKTYAAAMGGM